MLGHVFLGFYRLVSWRAALLPPEQARALQARWALRFSSLTTAGLDDDFVEETFRLVHDQPVLLDELERSLQGDGWIVGRQRGTIMSIRHALASGYRSIY